MPIENERKLLLRHNMSEQLIQELSAVPQAYVQDITQSYLPQGGRIRCIRSSTTTSHVFTYKCDVDDQTVEVETDISLGDYAKLSKISTHTVHKTRISICENTPLSFLIQRPLLWDVDFFRDAQQRIYLALAECEMPEFQTVLPDILPYLQPHAVCWIPADDKRFASKRLHNPDKVHELLSEFL
jgi:CYTH domain-containing protein